MYSAMLISRWLIQVQAHGQTTGYQCLNNKFTEYDTN